MFHERRYLKVVSEELNGKKTVVLNILDDYEYMDDELQEILKGYVEEYL